MKTLSERYQHSHQIKQAHLKFWELSNKHFHPEGSSYVYENQQGFDGLNSYYSHISKIFDEKYTILGSSLFTRYVESLSNIILPKFQWVNITPSDNLLKGIAQSLFDGIDQGDEEQINQIMLQIKEFEHETEVKLKEIAELVLSKMNGFDNKIVIFQLLKELTIQDWCVLRNINGKLSIVDKNSVVLMHNGNKIDCVVISKLFSADMLYQTYGVKIDSGRTERIVYECVMINDDGSQTVQVKIGSVDANPIKTIELDKFNQIIIPISLNPTVNNPYGFSKCLSALSILGMLNSLENLQNELAHIATYGIYQQQRTGLDDDTNPEQVGNFSIIKTPTGAELKQLGQSATRYDLTENAKRDYKQELYDLFFIPKLDNGGTTPLSAEDVRYRKEQAIQSQTEIYFKMRSQFITQFTNISLIQIILEKHPEVVMSGIDEFLNVEFKSVYDIINENEKSNAVLNEIQTVVQMFGQETASIQYNKDEVIAQLQKSNNTDPALLNTPSKQQDIIQNMLQLQQQQAQSHITQDKQEAV